MRRLTADKKIGYSVALAALAASVSLIFVPEAYVLLVAAPTFAVAAALAYMLLRKRSIHSYNKHQVTLIVSVIAMLYLTAYYISGIKFGFVLPVAGTTSPIYILKHVIPITVIIFSSELLRDILIAKEGHVTTVISYAVGVASAAVCAGGITGLNGPSDVADFLGTALFPALTANLLFTYVSRRYGMLPNVIYRLLLTLHVFLVPITSDVPKIFVAFALLILPLLIQAFIDVLFEKKRKSAKRMPSKWRFVFPTAMAVLMIAIIMLVTCQFRYGILVIATESMSGEIEKGDAVVYESYESYGEIKENDVIVFEENGRRVVHRVVSINHIDGERQYITKGDANEGIDPGYRTDQDIVGVVHFRLLYIGYPSVWLRQAFAG